MTEPTFNDKLRADRDAGREGVRALLFPTTEPDPEAETEEGDTT